MINKDSKLSNVDGVLNAVVIEGDPVGKSILQGEGAGPGPTTSALVSDICSVLRGNIKYPFTSHLIIKEKIFNHQIYLIKFFLHI